MTQPADARSEEGNRFYQWKDERFWSVTTILNVISKPALVPWAARQAATYALAEMDMLSNLKKTDPSEVVRLISTAHKRSVEHSSEVGNDVHDYIQQVAEGKPLPDYEPPHIQHFRRWESIYKPDYILSEATVYNRKHKYAGTLDLLIQTGGETVLLDIKSGNNVYPEVALQLSAYAHGEFIGRSDMESELPVIDRAAVLHIRPNGYKFKSVYLDDEVFESFLHCRGLFDWTSTISKTVLQERGNS